MDFAVRLAREGEIDGIHEVAFGKSRAVLGFSVKEGLNGSRRTPRLGQTPVAKGEAPREPFVDIFDEGHEYLRVIAEMPGIDPQNVMVKAEGDLLPTFFSFSTALYPYIASCSIILRMQPSSIPLKI